MRYRTFGEILRKNLTKVDELLERLLKLTEEDNETSIEALIKDKKVPLRKLVAEGYFEKYDKLYNKQEKDFIKNNQF